MRSASAGSIAFSTLTAFGPTLRPVPASEWSSCVTRSRQITSTASSSASLRAITHPATPAPTMTMRNAQPTRPLRAIAEHDDLVALDFDAGRNAGARRLDGKVAQQGCVVETIRLDLLQSQRDAECACRAGKGHRFIGIIGKRRLA